MSDSEDESSTSGTAGSHPTLTEPSGSSDSDSDSAPGLMTRSSSKQMFSFFQKNITVAPSSDDVTTSVQELNSRRQLGMAGDDLSHSSLYDRKLREKASATIFHPLKQPRNYHRPTAEGKFPLANLSLRELIDPDNILKPIKPTYDKEAFSFAMRLADAVEGKRSLLFPLSTLETTFLGGAVARLTECFRLNSDLMQFASCNINPDAFKSPEVARVFQQTFLRANNAMFDEIINLANVFDARAVKARVRDYDDKLLHRHIHRIQNYPLNPLRDFTGKAVNFGETKLSSWDFETAKKEVEIAEYKNYKNISKELKRRYPGSKYATTIPKVVASLPRNSTKRGFTSQTSSMRRNQGGDRPKKKRRKGPKDGSRNSSSSSSSSTSRGGSNTTVKKE